MRIGVVSGSGVCIPLLYQLKAWGQEVEVFFGDLPYTDKDRDSVPIFCSSQNVNLVKETKKEQLYEWIGKFKPELIFVAGYSHKIDLNKTGKVKNGIYNIHYGKLPAYRGPNPVFWQLKNGEEKIGLCIHELSGRLDAGAIVWQQEVKNEVHFNYSLVNQIFSNFQVQGAQFILNFLQRGMSLIPKPQDETKAGYYRKPQLNDVLIHWSSMSPETIIHLVKACNSWNNGAITAIDGMEVKILDAESCERSPEGMTPGTIIPKDDKLFVACSGNKSLDIGFLSINGVFVPARHASFHGLVAGRKFTT